MNSQRNISICNIKKARKTNYNNKNIWVIAFGNHSLFFLCIHKKIELLILDKSITKYSLPNTMEVFFGLRNVLIRMWVQPR